jgi:poly-gamma-glutamate capsule biosynthesis protein CapA/YwtB (metallophosphatase superfamily)
MNRRHFFARVGSRLLGSLAATVPLSGYSAAPRPLANPEQMSQPGGPSNAGPRSVKLFLCGDVMTGRGVDQILPYPSKPHLYEPYVRSALGYVEIAEQLKGPIARPVDFAYIWGEALGELERARPDARIINLETAVTVAEDAWPGKGIHYRMHPANAPVLSAAGIDCCTLANNHVLDWGYAGLTETLDTLRRAGIRTAGAGRDEGEAAAPATIELRDGARILVFAFGMQSAGVPVGWAAGKSRGGVSFLGDLSKQTADRVARRVHAVKQPGDIVVASIHWGGNWGYAITRAERYFAHELIDTGGVNVVHGHSSHHPKAIEIYRDKPILYGCGDFLNDYEGIRGRESFRPDLTLMYFPTFDGTTGRLSRFTLVPMRIEHFRLNRAREEDARWFEETLNHEGRDFGTRLDRQRDNTFLLRWS